MRDIYEILSRHFAEEGSEKDKIAIETFKNDHDLEYQMLARLWQRNDVQVKDFDADKAWQSMGISEKTTRDTRIVRMTPALLRFAAAVIIFMMGAAIVYYYQVYTPIQNAKTVHVSNPKRGTDIALADGTIVWLNKNANISYPKLFTGKSRTLEFSGEAFFNVKKDPDRPFIIRTQNSLITVLGTSFNVRSTDNITVITVKSGHVRIRNLTTAKVEIITPGYTAKIERDQLIKFQTKSPNYLSWKTGSFKFNHASLKQVISDLNTYYDKKIVIDEKKPVDCNLTAQFNKTSQQDILNIIKLTCTCEIRESEDSYYVYAIKSNKP